MQIAHESSGEMSFGWGRQPAFLGTFSKRLNRCFNDATNGVPGDGWSLMSNDGAEDVPIVVDSFSKQTYWCSCQLLPDVF